MRKSVDNVNRAASAPSAADTAEKVLDLVHTVMHQFRSLQYQVLREGAHELTHMEYKVMGFFAFHAGATLSDLVQHSGRDKAQLARLVKGLRERELLVAEPDPADRRNVRLSLSQAGQGVLRALDDEAQVVNLRAVQGLDGREQAQLIGLLERVKRNLGPAD